MSSDCPICLEPITNINCTTTECGHTFHSCCIFKNLSQNNGCPMCRKELVEVVDSEDDDDEDDLESDSSSTESYDDDGCNGISVFQYTEALKRKGFTEYDFVRILLRQQFIDLAEDDKKGIKLVDVISNIYEGNESVDYRDKRSYVDVLLGKEKVGETGLGPESIYSSNSNIKKVNFVV